MLRLNPLLFWAAAFVLGLSVGSFLNVVIHRLPIMLERQWNAEHTGENEPQDKFNLATPASRCPHCGHLIRAWENIPLLSYLFLRGQCSQCHASISPRYPIVELFTGVVVLISAVIFGVSWEFLWAALLSACLIALSGIDIDQRLLPDVITLPVLWIGLLVNTQSLFADLQDAVIGAIAGYLILWFVFHGFKKATGKEGLGYGDFKLLALLGAWLGWVYLPIVILLSSLSAALIGGAIMLVFRKKRDFPIPFGPFLAGAGWACLLWGDEIMRLYTTGIAALG